MTGLQAARELHRRRPELPILILTMHENEQYLEEALRAGAAATSSRKPPTATSWRPAGRCCGVSPSATAVPTAPVVRDAIRRARRGERPRQPLTPRETEIVKLVAESYTNKEIAQALVISEKTVDRHRANILQKLGLHDRVELTRYAIRNGLADA